MTITTTTTFGGRKAGAIGYGLLPLTWRNPMPTEEEAFLALRTALENGCNMWNGGEIYGTPEHNSLTLLNKYFEKYPEDADKVILNIKGASKPNLAPDGSPEFVTKSALNCVKMLGGRGRIDMFEPARKGPNVPIEETVGALAKLATDGKIGDVALSEVSAATIRAAAKVTKIVAVEVELSLWCTDPLTNGIAEAGAELSFPIIPYSPMGRGFLTGQIKSIDDLLEKDIRRMLPRYQPGNFESNMKLVKALEAIANRKGCTSAQLAVNWVRCLSTRPGMPQIFPIPGSGSAERIAENARIVDLTADDMAEIDTILGSVEVVGNRYHEMGQKLING